MADRILVASGVVVLNLFRRERPNVIGGIKGDIHLGGIGLKMKNDVATATTYDAIAIQ